MEIDQGKAKGNTQKKELVKDEPIQFHISVTTNRVFLVFSGNSGNGMWSWSHPVKEESFYAQIPAQLTKINILFTLHNFTFSTKHNHSDDFLHIDVFYKDQGCAKLIKRFETNTKRNLGPEKFSRRKPRFRNGYETVN